MLIANDLRAGRIEVSVVQQLAAVPAVGGRWVVELGPDPPRVQQMPTELMAAGIGGQPIGGQPRRERESADCREGEGRA